MEVTLLAGVIDQLRNIGEGNVSLGIQRATEWYGAPFGIDAAMQFRDHSASLLANIDNLALTPDHKGRYRATLERRIRAYDDQIRQAAADELGK